MTTIDLRDEPRGRGFGDLRNGLFAPFASDPASRVQQRVLIADLISAGVAMLLAGQLPALDLSGWTYLPLALWVVALGLSASYDRKRLLNHGAGPSSIFGAASRALMTMAVLGWFIPTVSARQGVGLILLLTLTTMVGRWIVAQWLVRQRRAGRLLIPVLARGSSKDLRRFIRMISNDRARSMDVVAVQCTDRAPIEGVPNATRVPLAVDPVDAGIRNSVSAIVIVGPTDLPSDDLRRAIWRSGREGIDTLMMPIVEPVAVPRVAPLPSGGFASMVYQGPNRRLFRLKMLSDRLLAGLGLLVLSPVLLGISVAVRATSPGPVLFRQTRVGRDGQTFTMLKFRTMQEGAETMLQDLAHLNEHDGGTLFKIRNDPRVTTVGRWLRKFSLDELPQLINVVRGEMSLVGPRPPLPDEVANYSADSMRRFTMNPGLTGLWQVSGRANLDPEDSARLDTQYVENWTFGLDLRILAKTAKVVVSGDGAY